jgi:hypothetical protein
VRRNCKQLERLVLLRLLVITVFACYTDEFPDEP